MVQCLANSEIGIGKIPERTIPTKAPQHRMKLLLVDDEPEICLLLNALLVRYGASTTMAHSIHEAEDKIRAQKGLDGVFLDVNLPDGKGYELIPMIRKSYPSARVIVISAMDQERSHAIAAGADLFLAKPLD